MLKISDIKITDNSTKPSKELDDIFGTMKKFGIENPESLLPQVPSYNVEFKLKNTHVGFANAIRRILIEELPVKCMDFDEKELETDNDFILSDKLIKNLNLIPIRQEIDMDEYNRYTIFLYKYNDTDDIIEVNASDIKIAIDGNNDIDNNLLITYIIVYRF